MHRGKPRRKGYSFQKTHRLLNKHGKVYRDQDHKPGAKPGAKHGKRERRDIDDNQSTAVNSEPATTQDHYSELLQSLKKKPRLYFEELLGELREEEREEEEEEEEGKESEEEEGLETIEEEDEESSSDESEETPARLDSFKMAFGSDATLADASVSGCVPVPNTLYRIEKSGDVPVPVLELKTAEDLASCGVEPPLSRQWCATTKQLKSKGVMKPLSTTVYPYISQYNDLLLSDSNFENQPELLKLLALHSVNHVIKTRKVVLKNNARLARAAADEKVVVEDVKDQGFTRPKVLVLLPFRNVAHRFVHQLAKLALPGTKKQISNRKRFEEEYGPDSDEKPNLTKSLSYQKLFLGNNDDMFTLGIALSKNSVKLYTDFYSSDIIIASPLGLRMVVGGEGDKERDYDFLSSIEILSLFMCDVFLMQNWEHLIHCIQHINLHPTTDRGTDFSRVKMWMLDDLGKRFRQNLLFSSFLSPEINSLFNKECNNRLGEVKVAPLTQPHVLGSILYPVRQVFLRMRDRKPTESHVEYMTTGRYEYFIHNILPRYQGQDANSIIIVIPSYYDFVRIRNHFKRETSNYAQLSEYSTNKAVTNVRRSFAEGDIKYLLTTERFFFFKRYKLKNVQNVVFYEPPLNAECYSHYLNMMQGEGATSTLLYNKLDGTKLERIVGETQTRQLISSNQSTHMIISE